MTRTLSYGSSPQSLSLLMWMKAYNQCQSPGRKHVVMEGEGVQLWPLNYKSHKLKSVQKGKYFYAITLHKIAKIIWKMHEDDHTYEFVILIYLKLYKLWQYTNWPK